VSLEDFAFEVRRHMPRRAARSATSASSSAARSTRRAAMIEALAAALEIDPREFPEYRLALARASSTSARSASLRR
jgi:hypothetical protein